ncbi:KRR1 small subunit processome component [Brassica rapa]|uniref:KRR1 small subunit processome component n=1 Tax=Brassica campestris TaxID=3711 RepID=UPI00142D71A5|nr:KRR1 small subunit processome component [Brassica rapa]
MSYDIINIGRLAPSKEKFLITRILFLGHKSSSLKTLETSTNCFIRLQGNTVAAMGSFRALRRLRIIVEHCFLNGMRPSDVLKTMDAGKCGPNRFTKEKDPFTDSPWYLPSANTSWEDMLPLYDRF